MALYIYAIFVLYDIRKNDLMIDICIMNQTDIIVHDIFINYKDTFSQIRSAGEIAVK